MDLNYILHKYLNGEATKDEIEKLKTSPEYASYIKISEATSGFEAPSFNAETNFEAILSKQSAVRQVRRLHPVKTVLQIAAVLAVICVGYLYVSTLDTSVTTQIAEKETFSLPDNSEVILNSNSEISYNKKSWEKERTLSLTGEAYFRVTQGSTFSVNTPQGVVTVIGTQFNVFSRDSVFNINCYEGLVSVAYKDTIIKLPAGHKLKIEKGTLVSNTQSDTPTPQWIGNESHFENTKLKTVLDELQRQYPVTILTQNVDVNRRFTGGFTHSNLDLALQAVCDPLGLAFTITEGEVKIYAKTTK
ncbi:FecR family protein [Ulvibacter sp. MAR_2010_11]|uniref:FecR family protein n=1 Tax=Ulvibacter sp. MAR_2010_11 TaxID=1250229 RepID=UPI000C2BD5C7|nr:FecR domain-containing protein [Ulvibacter sp. MAR_2010_11]PKA83519.1 FecR family protein [Ulvibacter sp. MAR_2010_11]